MGQGATTPWPLLVIHYLILYPIIGEDKTQTDVLLCCIKVAVSLIMGKILLMTVLNRIVASDRLRKCNQNSDVHLKGRLI